mgnify:CR=1 FL=1
MAVTDIHPISVTLDKSIEYIINPKKTKGGELVSCVGCSKNSKQAEKDFLDIRELGTGRGSTLAQHMYQSFKPGEVTPEQAHAIGEQLAEELLKGQYQYIVATHVDKGHIHNHIIFNNIGYEHLRSFEYKNNRGGNVFEKIQKISDRICRENDLSVIENPELGTGKSHYEWQMNQQGQSWKTKLKFEIDNLIMQSNNFDDFLLKCKENDIQAEYHPENKVTLKFKMQGQKSFTRARTLGWWYDEPQIRRRIDQYQQIKGGHSFEYKRSKIIDTSAEKFQDNYFLKRWADIKNMQEASKLLNFLTEKGFSSEEELEDTAISKYGERVQLVGELNDIQKQIDDISENIKLIQGYFKYKSINDGYKKAKNKLKFEKENAVSLKKFNSIKEQLAVKFPEKKLPNLEKLFEDRTDLITQRNEKNTQYKNLVKELKTLDEARSDLQKYLDTNKDIHKKNELE